MFNLSEVIVRTNRQTNKQTDKQTPLKKSTSLRYVTQVGNDDVQVKERQKRTSTFL